MTHKNIVEDVLMNKYLKDLCENMYWNNKNDAILVYIKENTNLEKINPELLISTLLKMNNYENDFWFMSPSFDILLVAKLIESGFIILSGRNYINKYNKKWSWDEKYFGKKYFFSKTMMFAMLYNKYPILFLNNVHEPKTVLRVLNRYELKIDSDFDKIVDKCSEIHGEYWLSQKMRNCYKKLYKENRENFKFISFALYHDNELKAGEFGCIVGKMYISYSGYYEKSGAGTVQMIKMFRYLKDAGFICCNLFGEGFRYKYRFGTIDLNIKDYFKLFNEIKK
jgi:Leu/Phe-tRNA-protein transferase